MITSFPQLDLVPKHNQIQPTETLNPDSPALGGQLSVVFSSTSDASKGVRYIHLEMKRLERSIAVVYGTEGASDDEMYPIQEMLGYLLLQVKEDNLAVIRSVLSDAMIQLAPWMTAVLRNDGHRLQFLYARNVSLLYLSHAVLQLDQARLSQEQLLSTQTWFHQAKKFIVFEDAQGTLLGPLTHVTARVAAGKSNSSKPSKGFGQKILAKLGGSKHE